jgi:glycosyltransferase involved in cell wall biosynthesis
MVCSDTGVRIGADRGASLNLRSVRDGLLDLGHDVRLVGVAVPDRSRVRSWGPTCRTVQHHTRGDDALRAGDDGDSSRPGRLSALRRARRERAAAEEVYALAGRVVSRWRPDLVYERLSAYGTAGQRIASRIGVPLVVEVSALHPADSGPWRGLHHGSARALEASVLAGAQLRVAASQDVAGQVEALVGQHPGRAGRTVVVPNGVDARLFSQPPSRALPRRHLGLSQSTFAVGFIGTLRPASGLEVVLDALVRLPLDVHLVVAGDGPSRFYLQERAVVLGLGDRVHWLGRVGHDAVPSVLAACDAAIAPYPPLTALASAPLKIYEYLAAGLPVVASDVGPLRAVLADEPAGRVIPPGDPCLLAAALADIRADPTISARALHRAAGARVEHSGTRRAAQIMAEALLAAGHRVSS